MPHLIGQCCQDQIVTSPSVSGSGLNEPIEFTNVATARIYWNATRKARFGLAGVFYVEMLHPDGKYRPTVIEAVPDQIPDTNYYDFDFGGTSTVRITVT